MCLGKAHESSEACFLEIQSWETCIATQSMKVVPRCRGPRQHPCLVSEQGRGPAVQLPPRQHRTRARLSLCTCLLGSPPPRVSTGLQLSPGSPSCARRAAEARAGWEAGGWALAEQHCPRPGVSPRMGGSIPVWFQSGQGTGG